MMHCKAVEDKNHKKDYSQAKIEAWELINTPLTQSGYIYVLTSQKAFVRSSLTLERKKFYIEYLSQARHLR